MISDYYTMSEVGSNSSAEEITNEEIEEIQIEEVS